MEEKTKTTRPIEIYVVINHKVGVTLPDTAANYKRDAITKVLKKSNKNRKATWAFLRRHGFSCEKFVCQEYQIEIQGNMISDRKAYEVFTGRKHGE